MSVAINIFMLTLAAILMKHAYTQDACPQSPQPDSICTFSKPNNHMRDCEHDIYSSLCALIHADDSATDAIWNFTCTNDNYCMGCRYSYTYCYTGPDEIASHNCGDKALADILGWYDAFTMGGKFAICDMGHDVVMDAVKSQDCITRNQTEIDSCMFDLQNTIYGGFSKKITVDCKEMNTRFQCFQDILNENCPSSVKNVFNRYFQGVVSMSPCEGDIPSVPAGASGLLSSGLIMLLSMTLFLIVNCV